MAITPLPTPPDSGDTATFNARADAWVAALAAWTTEVNALSLATASEVADAIDAANTNPIPITHAALTTFRNEITANPLLAPPLGTPYVLTDAGILQGEVVRWNGRAFTYKGSIASSYLVAGLFTKTSDNTANDTTYSDFATINIPGFLSDLNTRFLIRAIWDPDVVNASTKNLKAVFGSVAQGYTTVGPIPQATGTHESFKTVTELANAGSLSSQVSVNQAATTGNSTTAIQTFTKDTSIDWQIILQANWTTLQATTATIKLIGYTIEAL